MRPEATQQKLDFLDTERAFRHKSLRELKQAEWMFGMLNDRILGTVGKFLLKIGVRIGLPLKSAIKATLYKHFVGGETLEDCLSLVEKLADRNIKSILDFSEEAKQREEEFEKAFQELLTNIKFAGDHANIPFAVFKTTAIASADLLEKVSGNEKLNDDEEQAWKKVEQRFDILCNAAFFGKIPVMIDAEESWIQPAIDHLTMEMMRRYNKEHVTVLNTYQLYRKDKLDALKADYSAAQEQGFRLGAKIVRGAYMEKERRRANIKGYPSPIHDNKTDTDRDYNEAVRFCMGHLDEVLLVVATHNEESSRLAAELIGTTLYKNNYPFLWFSQLLGMCDHISYTLAENGFNVAKYVPYGPVKAVTPYLIRRADENSSVAGQSKRELALLKKEIKRRISNLRKKKIA